MTDQNVDRSKEKDYAHTCGVCGNPEGPHLPHCPHFKRDKLNPLTACEWIVDLASWDEDGAIAPKYPYSWETIARVALDYARGALEDSKRDQ